MHQNTGHQSQSIWHAEHMPNAAPPRLEEDISADVCIVGAGVAGLSTAFQLARAGERVVVIDDGPIGGGETGRSTAHLSTAVDDRYYRIEALHGAYGAQLCYDSHARAVDWIETTAAEQGIDCGFRRLDGYLFLPPGEDTSILDRELAAGQRAGVRGIQRVPRAPIQSFDTGPCLLFPQQGQVDPLALVLGLAAAVERLGGRIFGMTAMKEISEKDGLTVQVENGARIRAGSVVVATNTPVNDIVTMHTKQYAYRTYAVALPIARGAMPAALLWDTSQVAGDTTGAYHYVRLQHSGADGDGHGQDWLIVGGEDHKTGQADDAEARWHRLEQWARKRFPVESGPARNQWSGQVMEPVDCVAFIGPNPSGPEGTYIITGDSGMGVTHAAIGAMLVCDLITGQPNPWAKLYDPSRKTLRSGLEFASENLNAAVQYADWLAPGDVDSTDKIAPGDGALVRKGLRLMACYRDETGTLHECSAVCPHLGGVVQWNHAEQSWDCPVHGSRFDAYGNVLNGPANSPLTPTQEPAPAGSAKS